MSVYAPSITKKVHMSKPTLSGVYAYTAHDDGALQHLRVASCRAVGPAARRCPPAGSCKRSVLSPS